MPVNPFLTQIRTLKKDQQKMMAVARNSSPTGISGFSNFTSDFPEKPKRTLAHWVLLLEAGREWKKQKCDITSNYKGMT